MSRSSSGPEVQRKPVEGLAAAFQHLKDRSQPTTGQEDVEVQVKRYLNSPLETVSCLKYWEKQAKEAGNNKFKAALCRLARFV